MVMQQDQRDWACLPRFHLLAVTFAASSFLTTLLTTAEASILLHGNTHRDFVSPNIFTRVYIHNHNVTHKSSNS